MISIWVIVTILLVHYFADFICQTSWQALNKSSSNEALVGHTSVYSAIWVVPAIILFTPVMAAVFVIATFWCHTITDYLTSRWVKKSFTKQDWHNGFAKVGFDQILHYAQLFATYLILR